MRSCIGDADRQQSCAVWLRQRSAQARPIVTWDASSVDVLRPPARHHPRGAGHTRWLAMQGLTLFDVQPGRVAKDLEAWAPITAWLDRS